VGTGIEILYQFAMPESPYHNLTPEQQRHLLEFAEVLDFGKAIHSTKHTSHVDEEAFSKMMLGISRATRILNDLEG